MGTEAVCDGLVRAFRAQPTLRAGSLITTVYGDSIAPRGGTVWLGSLIAAMAEFGISERLVRTSVFRLQRDDWLSSHQVGRRSYYSLTPAGRDRFATATHRIYGAPADQWDGRWCLLLLSALNAVTRDLVRKECGWLGFGALSANVLAHPAPDADDLQKTLQRLGVADDVVVIRGEAADSEGAMRKLAYASWNLDDLDSRYRNVVEMFSPAFEAVVSDDELTPRIAFVIQTLLIQEYRKVLLRDPQLPQELLPDAWHGTSAYTLCRDLYRALYKASNEYVHTNMETEEGALPAPSGEYFKRFGGLDR